MEKRYGAVIVFPPDASKDWCELALAKMLAQGLIAPNGTRVEEFDDEIGGPVWYIP